MNAMYYFFEKNGYIFEIMLSNFCFFWWMEKRKNFGVKVLLAFFVLIAASVVSEFLPFGNFINKSARTVVIFIICISGAQFCYQITASRAAFYTTAASVAQHFSYKLSRTILMPLWAVWRRPGFETAARYSYPVLFVVCLLLCCLMFGKKLCREGMEQLTSSPTVLFLLVGMQLCTNIFQNFFDEYEIGVEVYTIINLFDIITCLFLLALQCEITKKENEQIHNEVMKQVLHQQKQQMIISKENIELINIKCHDIKNQISMLGTHVSPEEIRELERAVNIYDTTLKTGNEIFDVILMEKAMACESKNIRLDCMVNGASLIFMKQSDIYSLFGNALDNAIEAAEKIEDLEKRFLSIRVWEDKGMLVIHVENYYSGELEFDGGLPKTTKEDKRYHGFGMKSIRMITEKYHGYFSVKSQDGIFALNILLPISKSV